MPFAQALRQKGTEGSIAKQIEQRTKQIPSDWWLWAAAGSIVIALALRAAGKNTDATFVGEWAPTFLLLGVYNKIVKLLGSD